MSLGAKMKVGIGVPCHIDDVKIAEKHVLPSISKLDPAPDRVFVYVNKCGLKAARTHIFDKLLIEGNCDIALQACVDYQFFKHIISHIRSDKVVTFYPMTTTPIVSLSLIIGRNVAKNPWAGCYSLPKKVWERIREDPVWDGTDGSVQTLLNGDYYFTRTPDYTLRRISKNITRTVFRHEWRKRSIYRRGLKLVQALKI